MFDAIDRAGNRLKDTCKSPILGHGVHPLTLRPNS